MDNYIDIDFKFKSPELYEEFNNHFKQLCSIYTNAKVCFNYAFALEYPTEEANKSVIDNSEPLQILRYTTSRLALIELVKLYKDDHFSIKKLINCLKNKHYGKFDDNNLSINMLSARMNSILSKHAKTIGLRDMVFAHQDVWSKIEKSKVHEIGYNDVRDLFDESYNIIHDIHELLNTTPYHTHLKYHNANEQLNKILTGLR